jgi:hypothetical protein
MAKKLFSAKSTFFWPNHNLSQISIVRLMSTVNVKCAVVLGLEEISYSV